MSLIGVHSISRKDNTNRQTPHVTVPIKLATGKASSVLEKSVVLYTQKSTTPLFFTDVLNQSWEAHLENMTVSGIWTGEEKL